MLSGLALRALDAIGKPQDGTSFMILTPSSGGIPTGLPRVTCAEERVRQEMRGGAMETYKLVVVVVKPFVDANMWRKGLAQRLSNLEERTQEVQAIATVIPIGCLPKSWLCVSCGVLNRLRKPSWW